MDLKKRLKALAKINAEAPKNDVERTLVKEWVETATLKRKPAKWREKGNTWQSQADK